MNWYQPADYSYQQTASSNGVPTRAIAEIHGSPIAPELFGYVVFTDVPYGTEVFVEVSGLPSYKPATDGQQPVGPFGFHVHDKGVCVVGDPNNPYTSSGEHWNPTHQPHGNHAGDFPVLFSNDGYARMTFFTNKFRAADVIGKSVVIHLNPDDYRTQPAGNSGKRIGCGVIQQW